jgi:glycosyltransferase involved in cell wall biosynthesis
MRILLDISPANFTPGGTTTYIHNLAYSLPSVCEQRNAKLLISTLPRYLHATGNKGITHKIKIAAWDIYYMQLLLLQRAYSNNCDLIHAPAFRIPLFSSIPTIVTFFDTTILAPESMHRMRDKLVLSFYMRIAAKKATHIITISKNSRQDIARLLSLNLERITVTYPGVSPLFQPMASAKVRETLERYQISYPYILSVCTLEPRKNLVRVLEAYTDLKLKYKIPQHLVLVGKRGWLDNPIFDTVKRLNLSDHVHFTGFVQDVDLPNIYAGADLFVYPSLYEGFGLPVLEAMACGVPVVTSNVSSLPEVAADAALLVDPKNIAAIASAMMNVLDNPQLSMALREKGLIRAKLFSWEKCADETFDVYKFILGIS